MAGRWSLPLLVALLMGAGTTESSAQELRRGSLILESVDAAKTGSNAPEVTVTEPPDALREQFALSPFYKKCLVTEGFPIVSSEKPSNFALLEAAYIVNKMLSDRGDIRQALVKNKVRLAIMATKEFTCDLPEYSDLRPTALWNVQARGYGPVPGRPVVVCSEENLLALRGDPYGIESTLVHELGHAIHTMGLPIVDPDFAVRITATFDAAKAEGLWKETHALTNEHEYWAEGVQCWFDTNGYSDRLHNIINTRDRLIRYDPRLAGLLEETFPNNQWKYLKPDDRKKIDHLKGFNPLMAQKFEWPAGMVEDFQRYQAKQKQRGEFPQSADYFPR